MTRELALITEANQLAPDIYSVRFTSRQIARQAKPGQFIMVQVSSAIDPFLTRPMSIADVSGNKIRVIYRTVGKGTLILKEKRIGDSLFLLGPLGRPIELPKNKNILLCAGGVGIAPLLHLARELSKKNNLELYFGAKNKSELILVRELQPLCENIVLATEDGSKGDKGYITNILFKHLSSKQKSASTLMYAAGPLPMLKKIQSLRLPVKSYAFLEERMGCGCGICFCCGVKKKPGDYFRTCTDGPVFDMSQITL